MKTYAEFLDKVIDAGIAAARVDYGRPGQEHKLRGAVAGFESCRGKAPAEIRKLLAQANARVQKLVGEANEKYWEAVCHRAEVEWVASVLSSALAKTGQPTIVTPTARSSLCAATILADDLPAREKTLS